jgi:hypothetical protein
MFKTCIKIALGFMIIGLPELLMAQEYTNAPRSAWGTTPKAVLAFQAGKIASPNVIPRIGLVPKYELTATQKAELEAYIISSYPYTVIDPGSSTKYYNCHNSAWGILFGPGWMNDPSLNWLDGSFSSIHSEALPGMLSKSFYTNYVNGTYINGVDRINMVWSTSGIPEHSAAVWEFVQWPSGSTWQTTAFVSSKWGKGPLCRHYSHYGFHPYWKVSTIQTTYRRAIYP